jgi:hypothetical protein
MKKLDAFIVFICVATIVVVATDVIRKQTKKPTALKKEVVEIVSNDLEEDQNLEDQAYRVGYVQGQNSLFIQINRPDILVKTQEYASLKETANKHFENDPHYKEIMLKGYVDGYHKAAELLSCPGN